ncbi:MAG: PEP-CTERM sorting domain-containing protein [Microcystis sp. M090S1]|jgi:hypothetical protein|uniref:PEP-CTERM sorting domain-containing protein n=1 Tax=Microcystis sp. M090S1 TaxID=2771135 RepID=UPI0025870707|nr:PEP-CTERM sorting domain-containing protein [Microcystis sp. M090S1]MCA2812667.1 PEP-CTERM sorting domain-containing protein [Microcystis sp. M090S1]
MMTTNKLTKTFASGSLAIGVLAGAVLTATSANAASVMSTWGVWTSGTALQVGDKKVTFEQGSITGGFVADPLDDVELMEMGGHYYFIYDATTLGSPDPNFSSGSFTYTIQVINSNKSIVGVDLDSDVSSNYGTVTETFVEVPNVLVSTSGSADPLTGFHPIPPQTLLTVKNTLSNPGSPNEALFQLQNSFHQSVPEPGTILGLLAVGGLGLVSRFKKQK